MSMLYTTSQDDLSYQRYQLIQKDAKIKSEGFYLTIFSIGVICFGLNNFHIKVLRIYYGSELDIYEFGMWRNIWMAIILYYYMKHESISIIDFNYLKFNFWFYVRILSQGLTLIFLVISFEGLRVGTANCFISMNPAATVIFATFILKEKFYKRYAIGITLCMIGIILLISNEKSSNSADKKPKELNMIFISTIAGIFNLITVSLSSISSKILTNQKINQENQVFYIGLSDAPLYALFIIGKGYLYLNVSFLFQTIINSIFYTLGLFLFILGLKGIAVNKTIPVNFLSTVIVIILGIIFLGEPLFFSDVLGCGIIIGYNIYNSMYPVE